MTRVSPPRPAPPPTASQDSAALALELAADVGNIGLWRHDLRANRLHYNDRAWALLHMTPRPEGLSLDEVRELIHPDDVPMVAAVSERALSSTGPTDMQARYRRADGQWRHMLTRRVVQRNRDGEPIAFVGVALDVTEQVEASQRSLELARRLEVTTEALRIGLWSQDGATGEWHWNAQMWQIYGLPEQPHPPTSEDWLQRCVHPADRDWVPRRGREWVRSDEPTLSMEYRIVRPDGATRWVSVSASRSGAAPRWQLFGIALDVTERHSTETALRRANERISLATRALGVGTWQLDLVTGRQQWDEQMFRLRGVDPAHGPLGDAERFAQMHPDDRERVKAITAQIRRVPEPRSFELRVRLPDGRYRWLASRTAPLLDGDGTMVGVIGLNWDVTDSVVAQQALRDKEVAERESRAKSAFLARMSHELRTPLNAVLGFTQLLAAELRAQPAQVAKLEHVRAAGEHLLELINDALDLSRLESDALSLQPAAVPLVEMVTEVAAMVQPMAQQHGVSVRLGTVGGAAWADRIRLRQVLINLLSNAVKYNRAGGHATIDASADGERVHVAVTDTGRGLSRAQLDRVFEPFNRLGAERSDIEGTGIGLAITKGLVERMGGRIDVRSEPGVGSVFAFELPAAELPDDVPTAAPIPAVPASAPGVLPQPRGRLLYIEDNPVNRLLVEEVVRTRPGLALATAEDGTGGVDRAIALQPELILIDMQLPDFDGFEVLRRLRAHPATATSRCVALSANALPDDIARALAAGFDDYWTKPIDVRKFVGALDALFSPS
jgi:PAS domain S-box-containing protein